VVCRVWPVHRAACCSGVADADICRQVDLVLDGLASGKPWRCRYRCLHEVRAQDGM
jgi:hypothetical protein